MTNSDIEQPAKTCGSEQCATHGSPTNFAADRRCKLDAEPWVPGSRIAYAKPAEPTWT